MEPEDPFPCSMELACNPYPVPDEPSPHPVFSKIHFNIIIIISPPTRRSSEWCLPTDKEQRNLREKELHNWYHTRSLVVI
jgi:hypothetical protein